MTLDEAILKACIIGEFKEEDYPKAKYAALADQAQKILAGLGYPVTGVFKIEAGVTKCTLPEDCSEVIRVKSRLSDAPTEYEIVDGIIYTDGAYDTDIFYEKNPSDITAATAGSYIFEIDKKTHFAIPYYMVYHLCKTDDVENAQAALTEWNKYAALLEKNRKSVVKHIKGCYGEVL